MSETVEDFPARLHRQIYKKSDNPDHDDNRNSKEFLDGYGEGYADEKGDGIDAICREYTDRCCPDFDVEREKWEAFHEWKRGYNAGRMRRTWEKTEEKKS